MSIFQVALIFFFFVVDISFICNEDSVDLEVDNPSFPSNFQPTHFLPKIQIAFLVRNKAHSLPFFLGNIERLNYPKKRIGLFIRADHSEDNSTNVLKDWLSNTESDYHHVNLNVSHEGERYSDEESVLSWTKERFKHVIELREEALRSARKVWADYLLLLDADAMIIDENIISNMMKHKVPVVSPMLKCTNTDSYANFWGEISEQGYYKRSEDYFDIQKGKKTGLFRVPMVHMVYFINLNIIGTQNLSFIPPVNTTYPIDDIILFAKSAEANNVSMFIDNTNVYGYMTNPLTYGELTREQDIFQHLKFQAMLDQEERDDMFTLKPSKFLPEVLPKKSKFDFDEIYMINLKRRSDRRQKMEYLFDQLGIDAKYFEAIDGKQLNQSYLDSMSIKQLPEYSDPYHKRNLKMGEIGCFLSHYFIWKEMIRNGYEKILIFEDDIRFAPAFRRSIVSIMEQAEYFKPDWELLYLGRKRMSDKEVFVDDESYLVYPEYTYWTLSYIINKKGAIKLLDQKPLGKLVAVDEYLPIMFDRHPEAVWKEYFSPRNLIAISAEPLLVEPTHYTGEQHYISDTEDSILADD